MSRIQHTYENEKPNLDLERLIALKETALCKIRSSIMKMENHIDFVKKKIEIRVHSFKDQLDDAEKSFEAKLDQAKEEIVSAFIEVLTQVEQFDISSIADDSNKINTNNNELQTYSNSLNSLAELYDQVYLNVLFYENESFEIKDSSIGWLYRIITPIPLEVKKQLSFKIEYIKLDDFPYQMLKLNDGNFFIINPNGTQSYIYDSSFKIMKTIREESKTFSITSDKNYCYIAKSTEFLKRDHDQTNPESIEYHPDVYYQGINYFVFHNDQLYICCNHVVAVYSKELHFINVTELEECEKIFLIKIIDNIACVSCLLENFTYALRFYKLPYFNIIRSIAISKASVTTLNNYFYAYDGRYLTCLNLDGIVMTMKELTVGRPLDMAVVNGNIFICLEDNKNLVKLLFDC